jgi:hypothetical protein
VKFGFSIVLQKKDANGGITIYRHGELEKLGLPLWPSATLRGQSHFRLPVSWSWYCLSIWRCAYCTSRISSTWTLGTCKKRLRALDKCHTGCTDSKSLFLWLRMIVPMPVPTNERVPTSAQNLSCGGSLVRFSNLNLTRLSLLRSN